MNSPIEYYGGKSYMTDIIKSFFPHNYRLYVEGFGGGASVLLNKDETPLEIYNDLEKNVYSLFRVISDKTSMERLQQRLYITPCSHDLYDEAKLKLQEELSIEDRAYYFFYLNRTSFNGIGGFTFSPVVRRGCSKLISTYFGAIDNLEKVWSRIQHAVIENRDIFELIDKYDSNDTFFYLDPPYVQSTRASSQKYVLEFDNDLHKKLVDRLLNLNGKALVSGYDHEIYNKLVENGWNKHTFMSPNTGGCVAATEVLWYNYNLENNNTLW